MVRFLHTSDWHLGMTRHFLSEGVQERFTQSRFDAIRELGRIAEAEDCEFVVVSGDIFDSNLVDRKTVSRALEALKDISVPVYLLPGNHDPLNAASVYKTTTFLDRKPDHVNVIQDTTPINVSGNVEIIGIPWTSKRPLQDLVALATRELEPVNDKVRVCVAHGMLDKLSPNPDDPALVSLDKAESAISQNKIHYLALGDRHSVTDVGESGSVWYSGSPEPTGYNEVESGFAMVTTIHDGRTTSKKVEVGKWNFIHRRQVDLNNKEDIDALSKWFENVEDKERTIVKLYFVGTLSLTLHSKLEELLSHYMEIFAAIETRLNDLFILPDDEDFSDMGFSGFALSTVERLRSDIDESDTGSSRSSDALALLVRLARSDI
jgi:DNA repair exonuclease SbcCD nuclease subunit